MQDSPTVLVPIRVLEGESIPEGVPELLSNAHVVLLGYHVVPDQTSTDQARSQFEDQAVRRLDDFTSMLEHAGATVESHLVFTHDGQQTIDRTSEKYDCLAVLIPNATRPIETVLVAVRGIVGTDRFVHVVSGLFAASDVGVTLYHVAGTGETEADAETLLDGIASRLSEEGLRSDSIDIEIERGKNPRAMIVDAASDHDAVVMGESDPSVTTLLFGMSADQVAKQFLGPVLVVQQATSDDDEPDSE
ncbi:universal stress protein [Halosimplex salinum]|uniref:universal stress protein n=1 Tax=Halosimplex salinum TaxID=1710538 RepID=UPI000F47CE32|nr:universal stress protein [Halosimplex salinum]